jgi:hypothetical protein
MKDTILAMWSTRICGRPREVDPGRLLVTMIGRKLCAVAYFDSQLESQRVKHSS